MREGADPLCPDCGGTGEFLVQYAHGVQAQDCACTATSGPPPAPADGGIGPDGDA